MLKNGFKTKKARVATLYLLFFACHFSFSCPGAWAQENVRSKQLFSPSVGLKFYEIAYELGHAETVSRPQVERAIIFLNAAMSLNRQADYILPDLIRIAARYPRHDYYELVYRTLVSYANEPSADLEVIRVALSYLLDHLNSREEREKILEQMLTSLGSRNKVLGSELATLLGLLKAEKTDFEGAKFYLMQAFNNNKYNSLAFEKLAEIAPEQITPAAYLEYLRLAMGKNPLDMETALAFAQYAERLQLYELAADAYEYCTQLFRYLRPFEALPASLYIPWAISNYNTQRNQYKCLAIASHLRQRGRFDLILEAIAAKAATKIGDLQQASRIVNNIEDKIRQLTDEDPQKQYQVNTEQIAWFYAFTVPDANKALDWANKAYSADTNSPNTAAILAYSLMMNRQTNWAKALVETYQHNQIAELTLAQIQLANGQKNAAIKTLKSTIEKDPGSLAAEHAKELLRQQGEEYTSPVDTEIVLTALKNSLAQAVVPKFVSPDRIISYQVSLRSSRLFYSSELSGAVVITNNSSEPLIVSDGALFEGHIRVDAHVSGDIDKNIPNLISLRIRPASPVEPGHSILVPLRLMTGELRRILLTHPQASLDIEFAVYLDPVVTPEGYLSNTLSDLKLAKVLVTRPGVILTDRYLQNRLTSLTRGRQAQKINTAELFSGLLLEQYVMSNRQPPYRFIYEDWMPVLLKSALVHNLADDNWVVRTCTMAGMFSLPLDYELTSAVAENLNDPHWPVRLMTVHLMGVSQNSGFQKVLDWAARQDSNEYVRRMAAALGGTPPKQQPQPQ